MTLIYTETNTIWPLTGESFFCWFMLEFTLFTYILYLDDMGVIFP